MSALDALSDLDRLQSSCIALIFLTALLCYYYILQPSLCFKQQVHSRPTALTYHPLSSISAFYRRRFDFLNRGFRLTGQPIYQFPLLRHTVVVLSGASVRDAFFTNKSLDLHAGFQTLLGAIPVVPGVTSDLHQKRIALIHKRLAMLQRNESLSHLIPALLHDTAHVMEQWRKMKAVEPFEKIYELVFQLTVRGLTSQTIADDAARVARLKVLYDRLDSGTTPASVLFPWFPSPAMLKKLWATREIYNIVVDAIDRRERGLDSGADTLQMLLDNGDDKMAVVGFIMGLLIAGARSTGTTASWLLTFLSADPTWRDKAAREVDALLATHATPATATATGSASQGAKLDCPDLHELADRLSAIPLESWESDTPVLDAVIRETLRVAQPHTAMRQNAGPAFEIGGRIVPQNAFVVYPFSDIHLNPEIYPEPRKWDPSRPEDHKPYHYVAWGVGKSVCQGTRLAKIKMKLVAAMFVLANKNDCRLVDANGCPLSAPPQPDWNDILTCKPSQTCFIQCSAIS